MGPNSLWIIKTTAGGDAETSHHKEFMRDKVIAIGWEDCRNVTDNGVLISPTDFIEMIRPYNYDNDCEYVYRVFQKFIGEMAIGDPVIVMRGYSGNSTSPVPVYGIVRISGRYYEDTSPTWDWVHKHPVEITEGLSFPEGGRRIPVEQMRLALGLNSCRQTIHRIDDPSRIERVINLLK